MRFAFNTEQIVIQVNMSVVNLRYKIECTKLINMPVIFIKGFNFMVSTIFFSAFL